jgi:hypothetical protein
LPTAALDETAGMRPAMLAACPSEAMPGNMAYPDGQGCCDGAGHQPEAR